MGYGSSLQRDALDCVSSERDQKQKTQAKAGGRQCSLFRVWCDVGCGVARGRVGLGCQRRDFFAQTKGSLRFPLLEVTFNLLIPSYVC